MGRSFYYCFRFIFITAISAWCAACASGPEASSALPMGFTVPAPAGYMAMCDRIQRECPEIGPSEGMTSQVRYGGDAAALQLTEERWDQLKGINDYVNRTVQYETDEQQYGVHEYWTPAITAGNCKDYALAKRDLLWAAGWPPSALGIAIVYSRRTGQHAVLVATTAQGSYVLDSTLAWILPWNETDYVWETAQYSDGRWHMAGPNAYAVLQAATLSQMRVARSDSALPGSETPSSPTGG